MRLRNLILILAALATVAVVAACGAAGQSGGDQGGGQKQAPKEEAAKKQEQGGKNTPEKQVAPVQGSRDSGEIANAVEPPPNNEMKLTVPKMDRIKNDEIPTGLGTDETLFHDYAGVHIKHTAFPWDEEGNVYIAGHRLGYPGTDSYLAFWDLNKLEKGDKFYITDSEGRRYNYKVFRKFIATPQNLSVLAPIKGKNVATLQTCTLPDYTNRLLVRAELQGIEKA